LISLNLGILTLRQSSSVDGIVRESSDAAMIVDTAAPPDGIDARQESKRCDYGLSSDRSWITCHGGNVLWLPTEYRPFYFPLFAIAGATVGIGCENGRVLV